MRANLSITTREQPRLRSYIERLETEQEELRQRLREKNQEIDGIIREEEASIQLRDLNVRRGRVIGRASLWLESADFTDDTLLLGENVRKSENRVADLENQIDPESREGRLTSVLNRLGLQITQLAQALELEHSGNPVRLDATNLTIVVDRQDRPISLPMIGSGKNWVGYHLIAHLALHQHFIEQARPVPRFLFLDQPTQVYYPADQDPSLQGSLEELSDEDREAVLQMFNLIFDTVSKLNPDFQVIITDHADLTDERFMNAVVERWRGGDALIPKEWQGQ